MQQDLDAWSTATKDVECINIYQTICRGLKVIIIGFKPNINWGPTLWVV